MTPEQKQNIIRTIVKREKLRPLGRLTRLFKDPIRAVPYYILAALSHFRPYKISFKTLWSDTMTGYLPEANTFYYYGNCEANLTSFLLRFLKEGSIFVDIGAHIGFYSMLASHLIGPTGKVYSFEPTPRTYSLLSENTRSLENVKTNNVALSDTIGQTNFSDYGPGYSAYNTASNKGAFITRAHKDISIATTTLDQYCIENKVRPDFVKIDAEGLEFNILRGMQNIVALNADNGPVSSRPIITLEMANEGAWAENCKRSTEFLIGKSYSAYEMSNDGFIKPHKKQQAYTYTNILFVPNEKVSLVSYLVK